MFKKKTAKRVQKEGDTQFNVHVRERGFWLWLHHKNASEESDAILEAGLGDSCSQNKRVRVYTRSLFKGIKEMDPCELNLGKKHWGLNWIWELRGGRSVVQARSEIQDFTGVGWVSRNMTS